jgi:hypothetical protein
MRSTSNKTARIQEFLTTPANVRVHYTPTYSSWLSRENSGLPNSSHVTARGVFT